MVRIETFELERQQTLYENEVEFNLTESGVHPSSLRELLDADELAALVDLPLGYGHTEGHPGLRDAIATWYPGASRDNVLVSNGSAEANFLALWSLLEAGDELVFMLPNFMQLWGAARSWGIDVRPFHLREERDWAPDLDELRRQVGPRTRMIALSNPNNPTGAVLGDGDRAAIATIADEAGAWLLVDEIYRGAELDGDETATMYGGYPRTLAVSGMAKSLAHAGLRIGWLVGPEDTVYELMRHQDYTTIGTGVLGQHVAATLLEPGRRQALLARSREILRRNLAVIDAWVRRHRGVLRYRPPDAGGMVLVRYHLDIDSREFVRALREQHGVFVVAGDWFGLGRSLRIGIGSEPGYLDRALERIDAFIEGLRRRG